jgi:hypothetical protein
VGHLDDALIDGLVGGLQNAMSCGLEGLADGGLIVLILRVHSTSVIVSLLRVFFVACHWVGRVPLGHGLANLGSSAALDAWLL